VREKEKRKKKWKKEPINSGAISKTGSTILPLISYSTKTRTFFTFSIAQVGWTAIRVWK
jgi:hypothetical protein